jgi:hypothetical protein
LVTQLEQRDSRFLREVVVSEAAYSTPTSDIMKPGAVVRWVHLPKDEDANAPKDTSHQEMIINEYGGRDRKRRSFI